jgi:hypothetical protein
VAATQKGSASLLPRKIIGCRRRLRLCPPGLPEILRRLWYAMLLHATIPVARATALHLFLLIVLGFPVSAKAQDARLKNITIATIGKSLAVSLNVEGAFSPEILDILLKGHSVDFSFLISLHRSVNFWFDDTVADHRLIHTIQYDPLKKHFTIFRPWRHGRPIVTPSLEEAQALMTQVEDFQIIALNELQKGTPYELRAKAELHQITLPYKLRYVFYFVALWDLETDWHTVAFIY